LRQNSTKFITATFDVKEKTVLPILPGSDFARKNTAIKDIKREEKWTENHKYIQTKALFDEEINKNSLIKIKKSLRSTS
jgi:hypothetical protein